jgi:hypothetical protein
MADLSRGTRSRRAARRPGWVLMTVLLVLAIGASSALVFTNKVELLKLAVILALWAAVVAAFVSVIYRRQSDIDQAKARDLKLVYDLQLDREISARREYELTVETQLRRELTSEIRAQAADEVAGLRAELAALRANLEILFDADLSHRPAIETDRNRDYADWPGAESTGRVTASRIDTDDHDDLDANTEESPIIDVSAEPPEADWAPMTGGAHRRPSETEQERMRRHRVEEQPPAWSPPQPPQPAPQPQFTWEPPQQERPPAPPPEPPPQPPPPPRPEPGPRAETEPVADEEPVAQAADWQPAPAEGQWLPAGAPGSNWAAPAASAPTDAPNENGSAAEYVGRRRAPEPAPAQSPEPAVAQSSEPAPAQTPAQPAPAQTPAQPAMQVPHAEPRRGRHSAPADAVDPGRSPAMPSLHAESAGPPPHPHPEPEPAPEPPAEPEGRRHRSAEDTGGQSVAELLARLQATPTGGGRRRRREE